MRTIGHYRHANEIDKNAAYDAMYDAAIAYMEVKYPEQLKEHRKQNKQNPRLVPDAGGTRQTELNAAIETFAARGQINAPFSEHTLPDIIKAILNLRRHMPRVTQAIRHAADLAATPILQAADNANQDHAIRHWAPLARAARYYARTHQIGAYNNLYDAAMTYMRKTYPGHPRLEQELARRYDAPLQNDENNARQIALNREVRGFRHRNVPAPQVPQDGDLPTLVTAILDLRPCVPRRNAPNAQEETQPRAQFEPVTPEAPVAASHELVKLLCKIETPPRLPEFLTSGTNWRGGPMKELKNHLAKPASSIVEYTNQRRERELALIGLRKIFVQDPDTNHRTYWLRFKEPFFEDQLMRLLARYLSPATAGRFGNLNLPFVVQQLHDIGANPQIVIGESARTDILVPLLRASHELDIAKVETLISIALDNLEDVRKVGQLPERLKLLGAIARACHDNNSLAARPRFILSQSDMRRISSVAAEIADALVQMRQQGMIEPETPNHRNYFSILRGCTAYLKWLRRAVDQRAAGSCVQLPEAIQRIALTFESFTPPSYDEGDESPPYQRLAVQDPVAVRT
jgi:hypothetical protein